jgi:hypothetical protein
MEVTAYLAFSAQLVALMTAFFALWIEIKKMHHSVNGNLVVLIAAVTASSEAATKAATAAAKALEEHSLRPPP